MIAVTSKPLTDDQHAQLKRDMPRDAVKTRSQAGQTLSYVDSVYVIDQLNEVFGYDGWSFTHEAPVIREGARPVVVVAGVLRAGGVERGDTGVGLAAGEKPDALETAVKAAVTDCLKRCARTWGARMGLALYDKQQESVGYSLVAQDVIAAWDRATDAATYDDARKVATKAWPDLAADERTVVRHAQERAASRVDLDANAPANTAGVRPTVAAAPKPSPAVQLACDRIAVALSSRTVVAAMLACDARGTAVAAAFAAAFAARRAAGVDLGDVEAVLAKARTVTATPAQWEQSAAALAAFDAASDAATLNAARKQHAAAIVALPEALRSGVKSAADARAAALGAPTAASALVAKAKAAKTVKELDALSAALKADVEARRIVTKADVDAVTDALNARAEQIDSSAAEAA